MNHEEQKGKGFSVYIECLTNPDRNLTEDEILFIRHMDLSGIPKRNICIALKINLRQCFLACYGQEYFDRFERDSEDPNAPIVKELHLKRPTPQDKIDKIQRYYNTGITRKDIARMLNLNWQTVSNIIKRKGFARKPRKHK